MSEWVLDNKTGLREWRGSIQEAMLEHRHCPRCGASYMFDANLVVPEGKIVTCRSCHKAMK